MPDPRQAALAERHRVAQNALAVSTGAQLGRLLAREDTLETERDELDEEWDPDTNPVEDYNTGAVPVVQAGQRAALRLGAGFIATSVLLAGLDATGRPGGLLGTLDLDRILLGVLVDASSPSTTSPALRLLALRAAGDPDALAEAIRYATELAGRNLADAERAGADAAAANGSVQPWRWRKLAHADACEWCVLVAEGLYREADTIPRHTVGRCLCGIEPVYSIYEGGGRREE